MAAGLTALVLAGTRSGGDPLANYAGVSHKALIEIGGTTMIERVVAALMATPAVGRIVIAIDRPGLLEGLPGLQPDICNKPWTTMPRLSPTRMTGTPARATSAADGAS